MNWGPGERMKRDKRKKKQLKNQRFTMQEKARDFLYLRSSVAFEEWDQTSRWYIKFAAARMHAFRMPSVLPCHP